jgi:hypothetical protein
MRRDARAWWAVVGCGVVCGWLALACDGQAARSPQIAAPAQAMTAEARQAAPKPPRHVDVTGTLSLDGCTATASQIDLFVTPVSVGVTQRAPNQSPAQPQTGSPQPRILGANPGEHDEGRVGHRHDEDDDDDGDDDDAQNRGKPVRAHVQTTRDPHLVTFRLDALDTRQMYRVGANIRSATCRVLKLVGPRGGLIAPLLDGPLALQALALRTEIEVRASRPNGPIWLGADAITLEPGGGVRALRFRTDLPGVTNGELQIATDRFAVGATQGPPAGLVATIPVALRSQQGWIETPPLDFGALVLPPPCPNQQSCNGGGLGPNAPPGAQSFPVPAAVQRLIRLGAPVYARVVPKDGSGRALTDVHLFGVPATVGLAIVSARPILLYVPPPVSQILVTTHIDPAQLHWDHVTAHPSAHCFTFIQDHELPRSYMSALNGYDMLILLYGLYPPSSTVTTGQGFCYWHEGGGGFFDTLGDLFSGFIDAFGSVVDDLSKLYADLKAKVVDFAASALTDLGIVDCNPTCHLALEAALDTGLAAMGLPPSLPNFDQLVDKGLDYLEDELVEETGIPPELLDAVKAKEYVKDVVETARNKRGLPAVPWLIPDNGFRPSVMTLNVTRNPASAEAPPDLLRFADGDVFRGGDVPLPAAHLPTAGALVIPVNLFPNIDGIPPPTPIIGVGGIALPIPDEVRSKHFEDQWWATRYQTHPCSPQRAAGFYTPRASSGSSFFFADGEQMSIAFPTTAASDLPTATSALCTP